GELALVRQPDLDHPAVAVRGAVHELGALDDLDVALEDLAGDRCVDVRGGLYRLYDPEARELPDGRALLRQLDEDDVPQLLLREVRDADGDDVAVGAHPLVLLGVLEVVGDGAHSSFTLLYLRLASLASCKLVTPFLACT